MIPNILPMQSTVYLYLLLWVSDQNSGCKWGNQTNFPYPAKLVTTYGSKSVSQVRLVRGKPAHQLIRQLSSRRCVCGWQRRSSRVLSTFSIRQCQVCSRVLLQRGCFPYWFSCRAAWLQRRQEMDTNRRNKWQQKCSNLRGRLREGKQILQIKRTQMEEGVVFWVGGGGDKKPTEWMTKSRKGILEVNEDTEMPDTFAGGRMQPGSESSFWGAAWYKSRSKMLMLKPH